MGYIHDCPPAVQAYHRLKSLPPRKIPWVNPAPMAYSRSRSKSGPRFRKRYTSRKSYGRKKATRTSRRKPYSRSMSTRSILDKTSQKKRDTMLSYTNLFNEGVNPDLFIKTDAVITSSNNATTVIGWMPTARPGETSTGQRGSKIDIALRTSNTIFAKGVKENIILRTNSSTAWEWRRITFFIKDFFDTLDVEQSGYFRQTTDGMVRLVTPLPNTDIYEPLFRGQRNVDWIDDFNAPVDTSKVDLKSDRRMVIKSGNDSATIMHRKLWYPMNGNIVYRDDEQGEDMFLSPISTAAKAGKGDYYILDMFRSIGGQSGDTLSFLPNATFYWHEK